MLQKFAKYLVPTLVLGLLIACGAPAANSGATTTESTSGGKAAPSAGAINLILGAYTTPREAYAELIPVFQVQWKEKTGQDVTFEQSYLGSGARSRAIVEGFEADITALSLEADIERIVKAGLITHDWKSGPTKGMVSTSVVAFAVRKGNPKGIQDWADLGPARPGNSDPEPQDQRRCDVEYPFPLWRSAARLCRRRGQR